MGRKNRRRRINLTKKLGIYGRLSKRSKAVAFCKLHCCYLEPRDIKEKKCNYKKCVHIEEI